MKKLQVIAGNCVIESLKTSIETSNFLKEMSEKFNFDLSSNISLVLSKSNKIKTNILAKNIKEVLLKEISHFEKIEVAGPGFLNIKLSKEGIIFNIEKIFENKKIYGSKKNIQS